MARCIPALRLQVVCSRFPVWPETEIDSVPWNRTAELEALATADVGLMTGCPAPEAGRPV